MKAGSARRGMVFQEWAHENTSTLLNPALTQMALREIESEDLGVLVKEVNKQLVDAGEHRLKAKHSIDDKSKQPIIIVYLP